jgi:hypothetical protein
MIRVMSCAIVIAVWIIKKVLAKNEDFISSLRGLSAPLSFILVAVQGIEPRTLRI